VCLRLWKDECAIGIIAFFVLILVVVVAAAVTVRLIAYFAPGTPDLIGQIVWGVAILLILVVLLRALGVVGHDIQIPHL